MNYDNEFQLVSTQAHQGKIEMITEVRIVPDEHGDLHMFTDDVCDGGGYAHMTVEDAVSLRDWLNDFIGDAAELAWNPDEVARDAFMAVVNPNTCTSEDDTSGSDDA